MTLRERLVNRLYSSLNAVGVVYRLREGRSS